MRRWLTVITTIFAIGMCTTGIITSAKTKTTPTPTHKVLIHTSNYYLRHEDDLMDLYDINQGNQTAFDSHGRIYVYNQTHTKALGTSIQAAMKDWNDKLGQKVFYTGTKKHHTLVVKLVASEQDAGNEMAWWQPISQTVQIDKLFYANELLDINRYMKSNYLRQGGTDVATVWTASNKTAVSTARTVEFARILAHEFGHALGLAHSNNPADLMYAGIGFSDIYDYDAVTKKSIWDNPLSITDVGRGKLALKLVN